MSLQRVTFLDGGGSPVDLGVVIVDGVLVPARVSEVRTVDFTNWSGSVTVAGAVAKDIPANATRKGGEIRAPLGNNSGIITLTLKKPDGTTTYVKALEAGSAFSLTINPGFVLPHEIAITGDTVGLTFEAVEYI